MNKIHSKTVKCKLKDIFLTKKDFELRHYDKSEQERLQLFNSYKNCCDRFDDCINRANDAQFICSHFIRSYVLHCLNEKIDIPDINENFIRLAFKAISLESCGQKVKNDNEIIHDNLLEYFKIFSGVTGIKKVNSKMLSYVFDCYATQMATNYKNNIRLNFLKYLYQFVNQSFLKKIKYHTKEELKNMDPDKIKKYFEDKKLSTQLNDKIKKELVIVKNDLLNEELKSNVKYHKWINKHKNKILPNLGDNYSSHVDYLELNPEKYLKYMLQMNLILETNNSKLFQVIPLRTSLVDIFVPFNTITIKYIFKDTSKSTNDEIWSRYFNLKFIKQLNNPTKYSFNHLISTDGLSVSINYIDNKDISKNNEKKTAQVNASKKSRKEYKNLSLEEIEDIKIKNDKDKKAKIKACYEKRKEFGKQAKKKFKALTKPEQEEFVRNLRIQKTPFPYIEDLVGNLDKYNEIKKLFEEGKIAVIDLGKKSIMTVLGFIKGINIEFAINKVKFKKEYCIYNYRCRKRIKELKRNKYVNLIDNKKKKTKVYGLHGKYSTIKELESLLSKYSSKTIDHLNFLEYTKYKLQIRNIIVKENKYNEYVKKLKWFGYINKKRHEDKLLYELEQIFGKDTMFIVGDWSSQGKIKHISTRHDEPVESCTPNMSMRNLLATRFKVCTINEYNTSKLHYKTEQGGGNLKVDESFKLQDIEITKRKELHSVLTFQLGLRKGCINRDYNAVLNMIKIVGHLIKHKKRPKEYTRTYQPPQKVSKKKRKL